MSKLLVVVDMQVDFVTGALGSPEAARITANVLRKVEAELSAGTCVVFTKDTHQENYLETQEGKRLPVVHCIKGSEGWKLIPELQKYEAACPVYEKGTFGSMELAEYIGRNAFGEIELIGVCTDICVISNALLAKAAVPEAEISVDASCCAGVSPESHQTALEAMKMCQITIKE